MEQEKGTATVVAEVVERLAKVEEVAIVDGDGLIVIPNGKKVVDLLPFEDARLERPRRREGTSEHDTLDSFLEHVERHHDDESAIFADEAGSGERPSFVAIYDYHEAALRVHYDEVGEGDAAKTVRRETPGLPRWCKHRAHYTCPLSEEWLAWTKLAGPGAAWLTQLAFAQALEERGLEIVAVAELGAKSVEACRRLGINPAGPSTMLALSRGLMVRADRKVGSAHNLDTGEARISFEETHTATVNDAPIVVPNGFVVSIPVFRDGAGYAAIVRCRHRVEGSAIKWQIQIHRPDLIYRDAFADVAQRVEKATGLPVFRGSPEE